MLLQLSRFELRLGLASLHFAAGGFGQAADLNHSHIPHAQARALRDLLRDRAPEQSGVRRFAFGADDQGFFAVAHDTECDHGAALHAGYLGHRPFDILRIVVRAMDDDEILAAAADVELAIGDVAEIARIQPTVAVSERRGIGLFEITTRNAGA